VVAVDPESAAIEFSVPSAVVADEAVSTTFPDPNPIPARAGTEGAILAEVGSPDSQAALARTAATPRMR
jgi:di/tripeptidase